jgi:hypothetical protein
MEFIYLSHRRIGEIRSEMSLRIRKIPVEAIQDYWHAAECYGALISEMKKRRKIETMNSNLAIFRAVNEARANKKVN